MSNNRSWICKGCWQQMRMPIPIRGPFAFPFRLFGIRTSQMNPNLCTICETMFTKVKKKKQVVIQATVLFADLRGFTGLSERVGGSEAAEMLHGFYDTCCAAIWERDAIVNKFLGDGVLAVFNFPIGHEDHARRAVLAAMELQRRCHETLERRVADGKGGATPVGVGIGIHTGECSIGEVGTAYRDFTIIGPVVNTASRMQTVALPGEIVVTEPVYRSVKDLAPGVSPRSLQVKGIEQPVTAYVLRA
jgi:class 3 adenylate cyclase